MMHITFVKKILEDGSLCKKCRDVSDRLALDGLAQYIDQIVIADVRESSSPGMRLAEEFQVARAPFFIVDNHGEKAVFDVYFKLRKYLSSQGLLPASSASL